MNKKVIIIEKLFPFYRKAVFDFISQKVELKVLHGKNNSGTKSISTYYSEQIPSFQYGKKETNVLLFPIWKILKYKPRIVICDFALGILNLPFIILVCKLMKFKFVFWSHGYNRKIGFEPETRFLDKYRLFLLKFADANIIYSRMDKDFLQKYLNKEKLFVAQNTIDTSTLIKIRERLENEGKINIKKRLNIKHEYNIIFISRMLRSKKPELLIDIYEILKNIYGIKAGIHFIGDGEMLPLIKKEVHLKSYDDDYFFHGTSHDNVLNGELLYLSNIMVIPGDLGLSINYSFCFDCPVISFKQKHGYPAHGPEVEYVINNKTGFLVEEQTPEAMANVINSFIVNNQLRNEFTKNIRFSVENEFPLEKMVSGVLDCINYVTAEN
jgi:glycosyltransferase involved in cell wall biosynthesis